MADQQTSKEKLAEFFARPNDLHDMTPACGSDLNPCTRIYDADNVDEIIEALQLELKNVQEQYTNYHNWAQDEIERLRRLASGG